jgi:hypothetical protein
MLRMRRIHWCDTHSPDFRHVTHENAPVYGETQCNIAVGGAVGGKPAQSALGVAVSARHERVGDGLPNKEGYIQNQH